MKRVPHSLIIHVRDDVSDIEVHVVVAREFVSVDLGKHLAICQVAKVPRVNSGCDCLAVEWVPVY